MSGKAKVVISKLNKTKSGKPIYRVMKLINTRRLSLLEQDYEEDEIQNVLNSLPASYDYQIINNTLTR
tara:strand:- start:1092 stop:1295 length:204 start_codon:yes stop_codon:yes gene_type:complete